MAVVAPDLDGLRACVHCGICLPQCPTYRVLGEEMDSPRGRIYLMRAAAEGRLEPGPEFARHMDLCLGCRACESACPSGVPFGTLLEATRAQLAQRRLTSQSRLLARLVSAVFPHPGRVGALLGAVRRYQRSGLRRVVRGSRLLRLAPRLAVMDSLLPDIPRPDTLPERMPAHGTTRGRAGLLTGCIQRHLYPGVNRATAELLSLAGYEVAAPREQGCCGALELHAGGLEAYRARARRLAGVFSDVDVIVTNAAGCGAAMKESSHWLPGDADVARLARRVRDVSEVLAAATLPLGRLDLTVTYHDPCHLAHGQGIRAEPRALLARIPGLRLVPLRDSELCCGSAGVYNLMEPEVARRLLEMKVARIAESGVRVVATGNPGCMMQIAQGARARGLGVEVVHPVELLARATRAARGQSGTAQDGGP